MWGGWWIWGICLDEFFSFFLGGVCWVAILLFIYLARRCPFLVLVLFVGLREEMENLGTSESVFCLFVCMYVCMSVDRYTLCIVSTCGI